MRRRSKKPFNLDFEIREIREIRIGEWTPQRDGKGKTEQVHLMLKVEGIREPLVMRFKSKRALYDLITDLVFHAKNVWGPAGEGNDGTP